MKPGHTDARAEAAHRQAVLAGLACTRIDSARVYLIQGPLAGQTERLMSALLADPVRETATIGTAGSGNSITIEVHPLPGVMDPAAQSVRESIRALLGVETLVSTGVRFDFMGAAAEPAKAFAASHLANPVIHQVTDSPWLPHSLPTGSAYTFQLRHIAIRGITDDALVKLSRQAHLFLSLDEMRAIRTEFETLGREPTDIELETLAQTWSEHCVHKTLKSTITYRQIAEPAAEPSAASPAATNSPPEAISANRPTPKPRLGFEISFGSAGAAQKVGPSSEKARPTAGVSLESSTLDPIDWSNRPGHTVNADASVTIHNLLKSTIAAATFQLIEDGVDWALSVFKDNSGVVEFDDQWGINIKVETHNRPSAIEPYGGAATGIGGCIRDVIGTGLGAKPIASTDTFCVAFPDHWRNANAARSALANPAETKPLPPGVLHPARVLKEVVAGIRDYGNRMGIPTVGGGVHFDDRHIGNPLVFAGCVGLVPRHLVKGAAKAGDGIVALGGRTGRDGIHGATFSSAELESTASTEFAHAVQIGNAIEEKRVLDAILRARDARPMDAGGPLFSGLTDCGAGGFSSAVGEMGSTLGAEVHLDRIITKYDGLSYTETWISEAQERMILSVPQADIAALASICGEEGVEMTDLGVFGTPNADLILHYHETKVGQMPMAFIHDGIPMPVREAAWSPSSAPSPKPGPAPADLAPALLALLAHPSIASKHWIIRQYDHEVQGNTVIKPLCGIGGRGPSDSAVIQPVPASVRGIALASGLQTGLGDSASGGDPYHMALAAIDECVRNLVCSGADPSRIAILDNFCWPSCEKPANLASLVRACEGCYDGALAYRTPFVSGKDSLNNQLRYTDPETGLATVIEIPATLLISGLGLVRNVNRCITMDAKSAGNTLLLVGTTQGALGGSHYARTTGLAGDDNAAIPTVDLTAGPATARAVAQLIADGLVQSAHDVSDGGWLTAVAEMLIATTGAKSGGTGTASDSPLDQLLAGGSTVRPLGAVLTVDPGVLEAHQHAFCESPSRYVLEVRAADLPKIKTVLRDFGALFTTSLGTLDHSGTLSWPRADLTAEVAVLADRWLAPLDW